MNKNETRPIDSLPMKEIDSRTKALVDKLMPVLEGISYGEAEHVLHALKERLLRMQSDLLISQKTPSL